MEENYFIVYTIRFGNDHGDLLAKKADIYDDTKRLIKGFPTKRRMKEFVDEHKDGFGILKMLKPVS